MLFAAIVGLLVWAYFAMLSMPGVSHRGPLPALTGRQEALARELRRDVTALAGEIGPRNVMHAAQLAEAAAFIAERLAAVGLDVERQIFEVHGTACANLWVEIAGGDAVDEIVIVGAHYDTSGPSPGANDNGSGVAATLALARRFADARPDRTLHFVFFVNEEPPYFQAADMGSVRYAQACRDRGEEIVAMLSLETIGWYADEPETQRYPPPLSFAYPSTGDFIAFVGNFGSRRLVRTCVKEFRRAAAFPCEGGAPPGLIPGVGWSDHWSFWQAGYEGVMVTDTALFRYPHYHQTTDTPDRLSYDRMARVVSGLGVVVEMLAGVDQPAP